MATSIQKNLSSENLRRLVAALERVSRSGVYADVRFSIQDGRVGDHFDITMHIRASTDEVRGKGVKDTLDALVTSSANSGA